MELHGKIVWWLTPVIQREMAARDRLATVAKDPVERITWANDRSMYEDLLDVMVAAHGDDAPRPLVVTVKPLALVRLLIPVVWREMQFRERHSRVSEDEEIYWANDFGSYEFVMQNMLTEAGVSMDDVVRDYGDLENPANPSPSNDAE